jgi:hypothetical protein
LSRTSRVEVSKRDASPACAVNFQLRVSFRDLFLRTGRSSYLTRHGYLLLKIGRIGAARRGRRAPPYRTTLGTDANAPRSFGTDSSAGLPTLTDARAVRIRGPACQRKHFRGQYDRGTPRASSFSSDKIYNYERTAGTGYFRYYTPCMYPSTTREHAGARIYGTC